MSTTGKIKFTKPNEYWGKITDDQTGKDIYFNFRDLENEASHLLSANRIKDEPLVFEIRESEFKKGEKQAIKINLDKSTRKVGYIYSFEPEGGYGKIEDYDTKEKIFFHIANFHREFGKEDKFVRVELNEPVIFNISSNDKGKIADDIVIIDKRYPLEYFAIFPDFKQSLKELCAKSEDEKDWDYVKRPTRSMPILFSYINQTFKQIEIQNKLLKGKSSKDGKEYAYFNTGLVTPQQDEIYGYFVKNANYTPLVGWGIQIPEWYFLEFETENSNYRRYFSDDAEIATYFKEAQITDLIFDSTIKIIPDKDHLVKRKLRIESQIIRNLDDDAFIESIKESIVLAVKRIRRNYKTAIPHFYEGKIQFLLPLCFKANKAEALGALVVNRNENIYEAHTILSLDQALNNARLLAKPDREWLNP
jgi:cold shock CspA family protein